MWRHVATARGLLSRHRRQRELGARNGGKSEVLARTKKAKWATNEIGDLKVMVHGDAAVVTGSWNGKGTDGDGKAIDAKERWADTWVKTSNGKWQCIASASAPMK